MLGDHDNDYDTVQINFNGLKEAEAVAVQLFERSSTVALGQFRSSSIWIHCRGLGCPQIFQNVSNLTKHEASQHRDLEIPVVPGTHGIGNGDCLSNRSFKTISPRGVKICLQRDDNLGKKAGKDNNNELISSDQIGSITGPRILRQRPCKSKVRYQDAESDPEIDVNDDNYDPRAATIDSSDQEDDHDHDESSEASDYSDNPNYGHYRIKNIATEEKRRNQLILDGCLITVGVDSTTGKGNKIYTCALCQSPTTFPDLPALKSHLEQIHVTADLDLASKSKQPAVAAADVDQAKSTTIPHKCKICHRVFPRSDSLFFHIRTHHEGQRSYNCGHCPKVFANNNARLKHHRDVHSRKVYTCRFCDKQYKKPCQCRTHELKHVGSKPHSCSICPKKFWNNHTLKNHVDNIHRRLNREDWSYCDKCGRGYKLESSLKLFHFCRISESALIHETEVEVPVGTVESEFEDDPGLDPLVQDPLQHPCKSVIKVDQDGLGLNPPVQEIQDQRKPQYRGRSIITADQNGFIVDEFPIDVKFEGTMEGNNIFAKEDSDSDEEKAIVEGEYVLSGRPTPLPIPCTALIIANAEPAEPAHPIPKPKAASSPSTPPVRKIKTPEEGTTCPECGKQFATREGLSRHIYRHNNRLSGYKFLCEFPFCGKRLANQHGLDLHHRSHTGEKPFKCTKCDRSFRTPHGCRFHIMRHTDTKDFKCSYCDKAFVVNQQRKLHELRNHIKEKKFACSTCGKAFLLERYLKLHENIHSGLKPFRCAYCNRGFARHNTRDKHEKRHNKNPSSSK